MPQPPFQADAFQIEAGSGDTLLIERDSSTGAIKLTDAVNTTGLLLTSLPSLRAVDDVLVVGTGGSGAAYTTIQGAVDAVPATSSPDAPHVILVAAGLYDESVTIDKDGIVLLALGRAVIRPSAAADTLTLTDAVSTHPTRCLIQGFQLENSHDGQNVVALVGGAGSTVGEDAVVLRDCVMDASGAGTRYLYCDAVNHVVVDRCTWEGSSTALALIQQCASLQVSGLLSGGDVQLSYDTAGSIPSVAGSTYRVGHSRVGDVLCTLQGAGSFQIAHCPEVGDVTLSGDRPVEIRDSAVGALVSNTGVDTTVVGGTHGAVSGAGTITEGLLTGTVTFSASVSETVVFDVGQADSGYVVAWDTDIDAPLTITSKSSTGFTVTFSSAQTGTVNWAALRQV